MVKHKGDNFNSEFFELIKSIGHPLDRGGSHIALVKPVKYAVFFVKPS